TPKYPHRTYFNSSERSTVGSSYWGKNILSVNDVEWKKHRKAVWKETTRFFREMVEVDEWPMESGASISFGNVNSFTQRLALYAILSCGFGLPMSWDSVKSGMSPHHFMINLCLIEANRWRRMVNAVTALRKWFYKSVADKSAEVSKLLSETDGDLETSGVKKDIFSLITLASQQDAKLHLHDNELVSDILFQCCITTFNFVSVLRLAIFGIFAGHETTAGTLAVTFCYLAANKEEQQMIQREIEEISQKLGRETEDLPFEEYESLVKTRAAFVEALRLVPAANMLLRGTREDTLLQVPVKSEDGEYIERSIAVPKDTTLIVDMIGL
ncbi:15081_t:CDS:2, partial [Acaulospora colombiana]